jgi:hypothetical protein
MAKRFYVGLLTLHHESHRGLLNGPKIEKRGMTSSKGFHEGILDRVWTKLC